MKKKLNDFLLKFQQYLSEEKEETRQMLDIYVKYTKNQATKEEISLANKQLRDIFKSLGFGVLAILPFAVLTLPGLFWVSKKTGINLLPDWFEKRRMG